MLPQTHVFPSTSSGSLPQFQGYISSSRNGRYFQDEAGAPFIVIGHNDAITWPGFEELLQGKPDSTEAYIADLRAHGINVSRVMLEYAQEQRGLLENPVGVFSPALVSFWDAFIPMAERHGLYLLLTPYDTFWQALHWRSYPYNRARGGPCQSKADWLTSRACIRAQQARWEFIIRRWGGSPNIFAWDLMNEIDLYWNTPPKKLWQYIADMCAFVRNLELECWGRNHLITVSSATAVPQGELGEIIYNHPDLDFVNTHLYVGEGVKAPVDTTEGAINISRAVESSLDAMRYVRPYFDSETGPIDAWIIDLQKDIEYHHNISFAHLAAGGAGSGMRWPYSRPHHLVPELRANLLGLARFAASVAWTRMSSRNLNKWIAVDDEVIISTGCGDSARLVLWFLNDKRRREVVDFSGMTVTVTDVLSDGEYVVELWETYQGCRFECLKVTVTDGVLRFPLSNPAARINDIAVSVYPAADGS